MAFDSFRDWVNALDRAGELVRVAQPVATELEITELADREMKKDGGGEPKGELAAAIEKNFGNTADFKAKFSDAATKTFGSGWAWLVLHEGKLSIESAPNQDNPVSQGRQVLLGLDVWEHAYYLKYQNKRADYIAAWWNVVNWDFVAERFAKFAK